MKTRLHTIRRLEVPLSTYILNLHRPVHSSTRRRTSALPASPIPSAPNPFTTTVSRPSPLARLSTTDVVRSYFITGMSSSPVLLSACFAILTQMLRSKSVLMNVEKNPVLSWILKKTFYAQFCAGENGPEVHRAVDRIKDLGYRGVILEFALEVLGTKDPAFSAESEATKKAIATWRKGAIESVNMCAPGDFIGMKWSGLGPYTLQLLKEGKEPTPLMWEAITAFCDRAAERGVIVLPGAEEHITNPGIDAWNRELSRKYNTKESGQAIIYTTYQCYDKSTPANLARDLAAAEEGGYIAGVKLVRGAYLSSEPRHLLWGTIEETHKCYDELMEAVLTRRYNSMLQPAKEGTKFPEVEVVLATHNAESVRKARAIRDLQVANGEKRVKLAYAQLLGMADEISCRLLEKNTVDGSLQTAAMDEPRVFKCVTWGTTSECLEYLLRRASENKDAASRTVDTRKAMGAEIWRRMKASFGLA